VKLFNWIVEKARTQGADRAKAHNYLSQVSDENFRELMQGYDAFVSYMREIQDPSIVIGTAKDSLGNNIEARIATDDIHRNWLITGAPGSGKTSFVTSVFARALGHGYPIGILDCKNDFFGTALRWAAAKAYRMDPAQRAQFIQSLAVINPFSDALVPLNVCKVLPGNTAEIQAYDICLSLSRLFRSDLGFQTENILIQLLTLLIEAELTLVEAPIVMQDDLLRDILVNRSAKRSVKEFFLRDYPSVPAGSKLALLTRIQNLLLAENIRLMLGANDLIDLKSILDKGQPFFMFLGKGPGVPEEQVEVLASLILQLLFQAAFNTSSKRRPYQIVMDEFFHLIDAPALEKRFETALTTLRSFGVMLSLVMHNFSQVPGTLRESMLNNCDYMSIFRTHSRNAQFFGDFFPDLDPEIVAESLRKTGRPPAKHEVRAHLMSRLQQLPNRHCYFYDKQKPYRALLVRVPDVPSPEKAAGISEHALDDFMRREGVFLGGYALPKEELCRQIEERKNRIDSLTQFPPVHLSPEPEHNDAPAGTTIGPGESSSARRRRKPKLG
jgi:hypothetical protein